MHKRYLTPAEIARLLNEEDEELGSIPNEDDIRRGIDFNVETPVLRNIIVHHKNGDTFNANYFYGNGHTLWLGLGYGTRRNRNTKSSRPEFYQIKTNRNVIVDEKNPGEAPRTFSLLSLSDAQYTKLMECTKFYRSVLSAFRELCELRPQDILVSLLNSSYGERIRQYHQGENTATRTGERIPLTLQVPASIIAQAFKITFDELLAKLSSEDSECLSVLRKIGAGLDGYILSKDEYEVEIAPLGLRSEEGPETSFVAIVGNNFYDFNSGLGITQMLYELLLHIGPGVYYSELSDYKGLLHDPMSFEGYMSSLGATASTLRDPPKYGSVRISKPLTDRFQTLAAKGLGEWSELPIGGVKWEWVYDWTGPERLITMNVMNVAAVFHA